MAHRANVELSGQYIGKFQCKIGYGKATPTTRIWVGGLGAWTSITQFEREFDRFGAIKKIEYNKGDTQAYILYDSIDAATAAVKEMRGFPLGAPDRRIRIDFANNGTTPSQSAVEVLRKAVNIVAAPLRISGRRCIIRGKFIVRLCWKTVPRPWRIPRTWWFSS
ncbi:RNA-binding protein spenito-like [Armigeres subalbatus]|uniref:RNA-binding protein spenito-like n=1 Tax=Armigeres subalbatus TaxID=124917 RepID=UPI002ED69EBE